MTTVDGPVRHPKGESEESPGLAPGPYVRGLVESSVGSKVLIALTGFGLVTFVSFHLIGNLKLLSGDPSSINKYAYFLKHDLGLLIWIARGGLLATFVLHIVLAVRLKRRALEARPVPYVHAVSAQAGIASRSMIWTGAVVGLFTLFHLAHFTFGLFHGVYVPTDHGLVWTPYLELKDTMDPLRHNVYEMMVAGFSNVLLAAIYLIAQVVLFVHLRHGIPSLFQTLGLKNVRFRGPIDILGLLIALTILIGNSAIVLAVQFGWVTSQYR
jgi:succinate dehydrogenase / fumarate reductase cytochrome b subunit